MLYFSIQTHGRPYWLCNLLQQIKSPAAQATVYYDGTAEDFEAVRTIALQGNDAAVLKRSVPGTWSGPSMVTQMRQAMEEALATPGWEYFINLSGECFLLKPVGAIISRLQAEAAIGKTSFCYWFEMRRPISWLECRDWDANARDVVWYHRIRFVSDEKTCREIADGGLSPLLVASRPGVFVRETGQKGLLFLRGLYAWEIKERQAFFEELKGPKVGRQWVVLHRKMVEWLLSWHDFNVVYRFCTEMYVPDEMFYQTLILHPANPLRESVSNDNLRFKTGDPGALARSTDKEVLETEALFGRKISQLSASARSEVERRTLQSH